VKAVVAGAEAGRGFPAQRRVGGQTTVWASNFTLPNSYWGPAIPPSGSGRYR